MRFGVAPSETEDVDLAIDADDVTAMSWQQLQLLAARLVTGDAPDETIAITSSEFAPRAG